MLNLTDIVKLTFEPTSWCNIRCPGCPRHTKDGFLQSGMNTEHLHVKDIRYNLQLNKMTNLQEIRLEGDYGDPLMNPSLMTYIEIFKKYHLTIVTNGTIGTTELWKNIASYDNITVIFSIDGLRETNSIYRIGANFDKIIKNITTFINAGGHAIWKYLLFKHNKQDVIKAKEYAYKLGFEKFFTLLPHNNWTNGGFDVYKNGSYTHTLNPIAIPVMNNIKSSQCKMQKNKDLYINYKGHVLPCCMSSGLSRNNDIKSQMWQKIIGDVNSIDIHCNNITNILNSDFYNVRLQNSFIGNPWIHPICKANCIL